MIFLDIINEIRQGKPIQKKNNLGQWETILPGDALYILRPDFDPDRWRVVPEEENNDLKQ